MESWTVTSSAVAETGLVRIPVGDSLPSYVELLAATGLADSRSAARRTLAEGGAYVNNRRLDPGTDPEAAPARTDLLHGRWLVLRRGKRTVAGVEVAA